MLTIRREQMEAFHADAVQRFAARMGRLLQGTWPDLFRELGPEGFRALLARGIQRSMAHGLTRQLDIARYLNVMLALGEDFETAPATAWAVEILQDAALTPERKMDLLSERTLRELRGRPSPDAG
jgi:hypothetical protein